MDFELKSLYIYYTAWYAIFLKKSFMIWNFAQKCSKMFQNALKTFFLKSTYPNWLGSSLVLSSLNQNRHFSWGVTTFIFLSLSILDSSVDTTIQCRIWITFIYYSFGCFHPKGVVFIYQIVDVREILDSMNQCLPVFGFGLSVSVKKND